MKRPADRTLIIPTIRLRDGCCTQVPVGEPGTEGAYPVDPAELAVVWRRENTKMLHLVADDVLVHSLADQGPQLKRIVDAVDISIQIEAAFASVDDVAFVLGDIGGYRVVIDAATSLDLHFMEALVKRFGPRKIVPVVSLLPTEIIFGDDRLPDASPAMAHACSLQQSGVERIIVDARNIVDGPPISSLLSLVERTTLSVTLNGHVRNFSDLKLLRPLRMMRIDSIILENALYSNAFPCQKIWRIAEQQLIYQHKLVSFPDSQW